MEIQKCFKMFYQVFYYDKHNEVIEVNPTRKWLMMCVLVLVTVQ